MSAHKARRRAEKRADHAEKRAEAYWHIALKAIRRMQAAESRACAAEARADRAEAEREDAEERARYALLVTLSHD